MRDHELPASDGKRSWQGAQGQWPAVRYMTGAVAQRVYWAKCVVSGLRRFSRLRGKFLDRGGEWEEQVAWVPPGWRFVVWFDAGDTEKVGDRVSRRSWPQHRACYECVADPEARTQLKGTGKRQRGFVEGAFRIVRGEIGERAGRLMAEIRGRRAKGASPAGSARPAEAEVPVGGDRG